MGIGVVDINLVLKLREMGFFNGERSVVEIGAQQMASVMLANTDWVNQCAEAFGLERRLFEGHSGGRMAHGDVEELNPLAPPARDLWQWLGFAYASIDVDGSLGAIPLDLNFAETPKDMLGKASLVTNCGTPEHIANQVNAFKVIHELTSVGGVMLHNLPAQGYLVHGLINYNPKFFWALSAANGYKWLYADFYQSPDGYPLSPDIIGQLSLFDKNAAERVKNYRFSDCAVVAVMQKLYDIPFVPPIDVPTGSKTDIQELKDRYWTIFDTERFHAMINELELAKSAQP